MAPNVVQRNMTGVQGAKKNNSTIPNRPNATQESALANNVSNLNINNKNLLPINQRRNFINELQKRIGKVNTRLNNNTTSLMTNMTHNVGRLNFYKNELNTLLRNYKSNKTISQVKYENDRNFILDVPKNYNIRGFSKSALNSSLTNNAISRLTKVPRKRDNNQNNNNKKEFLKYAKKRQAQIRTKLRENPNDIPTQGKKLRLNASVKSTKKNIKTKHTLASGISINFNISETDDFFINMYRDMIKDGTIKTIKTKDKFIEVLSLFLDITINETAEYIEEAEKRIVSKKSPFIYKSVHDQIKNKWATYLKQNTNRTKNIIVHKNVQPGMQSNLRKYFVNTSKKMRVMLDCEANFIISTSIIGGYNNIELLTTPASILNAGSNMCGFRTRPNLRSVLNGTYNRKKTPIVYDLNGMEAYLNFTFKGNKPTHKVHIRVKYTRTGLEVILNGKHTIKVGSKKNAQSGSDNKNIIGKFFGDFLQVIKCIINNKNDKIPSIFASMDMNACLMYKTLSNIYIKNKMKELNPERQANFTKIKRLQSNMGKIIYLQQQGRISNAKYNLYFLNMKDYIRPPNNRRN